MTPIQTPGAIVRQVLDEIASRQKSTVHGTMRISLPPASHRAGPRTATVRVPFIAVACLVMMFVAIVPTTWAQNTTPASDPPRPGVLWRGPSPDLGLRDIAILAAPILWYSRDEPLLRSDNPIIPEAHPCDVASTTPVVYYQVIEIKNRGDEPVTRPEEDDPRFFEKVQSLILKYFFYYREDSGVGGHPHDLEAVEFEIFFDETETGVQVRLATVTALAHGSRWYSNILNVESDTSFPLALLVEEGKHATAPDRNGDGHYTPGYDVNRRVNDAWGVRDTLGSGVLLTAAYSAAMAKPRTFEYRLLPPETALLQIEPQNSSLSFSQESLGRYELRPANVVSACQEIAVERERLVSMMSYHGFGADQEPAQYGPNDIRRALQELRQPNGGWLPSMSWRVERGVGVALVMGGTDVGLGWIAAKINVNDSAGSIGALFTPSASRFADYYVAGGLQRLFTSTQFDVQIDTEEGRREVAFALPPTTDMYIEGGVRFRAQLPDSLGWLEWILPDRFIGARVGVRTLGLSDFFDTRFVFEFGAGAW